MHRTERQSERAHLALPSFRPPGPIRNSWALTWPYQALDHQAPGNPTVPTPLASWPTRDEDPRGSEDPGVTHNFRSRSPSWIRRLGTTPRGRHPRYRPRCAPCRPNSQRLPPHAASRRSCTGTCEPSRSSQPDFWPRWPTHFKRLMSYSSSPCLREKRSKAQNGRSPPPKARW